MSAAAEAAETMTAQDEASSAEEVSKAGNEEEDDALPRHCHDHTNGCPSSPVEADRESIGRVVDAFFYYQQFEKSRLYSRIQSIQLLSREHQALIEPAHSEHTRRVLECIDHNQNVLQEIICYGVQAFGVQGEQAILSREDRQSSPHFMSKLASTLKQIAREWSEEGAAEREQTFEPIIAELKARFPVDRRSKTKVLLPGTGLGRLAWDIADAGFDAMGNEYSIFMLVTSCFILNACSEVNQYTVYPYVMNSSNSWSYEQQTRPVRFPDVCPTLTEPTTRDPPMSMSSGDLLQGFEGEDGKYDVIVTSWFIDTAHNVIEYIELFHRLLVTGGVWINNGPLTYHYADTPGELSLELPYSEVLRIVSLKGFRVESQRTISNCFYASDSHSMLRHNYSCGFFVAIKE